MQIITAGIFARMRNRQSGYICSCCTFSNLNYFSYGKNLELFLLVCSQINFFNCKWKMLCLNSFGMYVSGVFLFFCLLGVHVSARNIRRYFIVSKAAGVSHSTLSLWAITGDLASTSGPIIMYVYTPSSLDSSDEFLVFTTTPMNLTTIDLPFLYTCT